MASPRYMKLSQEIDKNLEGLYSWIPDDLFIIELKHHYVIRYDLGFYAQTYQRTEIYPRHMILSAEHGSNSLLSLFANMDMPPYIVQTVLIPNILSFALDVHRHPTNRGRKVKKLLVEMEAVADDDEIDQVTDDSFNTFNFKPASTSSIQALKRVRVGDDEDSPLPLKKRRKVKDESSRKQCTICLEEYFLDGEEVTLMPCGHVFHDDCIVRWLETSHYCPLCRYQLPC